MGTMTLTHTGPYTRAERDALPDDGRRHEIIDGILIVTPAPAPRHQFVLAELFRVLDRACPSHLRVLFAPLDVALADDTVIEPDLLVARPEDFTERDLPRAPLLAVDILSPSTRLIDLNLKRERLERAGCPSYWVLDPVDGTFVAWELMDGSYAEVVSAAGSRPVELRQPFPVAFTPSELLR